MDVRIVQIRKSINTPIIRCRTLIGSPFDLLYGDSGAVVGQDTDIDAIVDANANADAVTMATTMKTALNLYEALDNMDTS